MNDAALNADAAIHTRGYWLDGRPNGHYFDAGLAGGLLELFQGSTVTDFGCGRGEYVRFFNNNGVVCKGIDGNPHTPKFDAYCEVADLSEPVQTDKQDWALSLEVGEHIPQQYESMFIENLHRHNRLGVVLSWAICGQGGRGHVNCRNNDYIKQRMAEYAYDNDTSIECDLRNRSRIGWFKNTLMVFRRKPGDCR